MIHRPGRAASQRPDGRPEPASNSGHDRRSYTTTWDAIQTSRGRNELAVPTEPLNDEHAAELAAPNPRASHPRHRLLRRRLVKLRQRRQAHRRYRGRRPLAERPPPATSTYRPAPGGYPSTNDANRVVRTPTPEAHRAGWPQYRTPRRMASTGTSILGCEPVTWGFQAEAKVRSHLRNEANCFRDKHEGSPSVAKTGIGRRRDFSRCNGSARHPRRYLRWPRAWPACR